MKSPSNRKRFGFKHLLFLMVPAIVLFVVLEVVAGAYLRSSVPGFDLAVQSMGQMTRSGYQLWEHPANYTSSSKLTHYNNLGFRRFDDTPVKKPAGTIRVFLTGGSAALGSQANPATPYYRMSGQGEYSTDETISAHLERVWAKRHPGQRVEVINAATNWSQIHQQMIRFYRQLRSLEPDLVISIDGQNDAVMIEPEWLNMWEWSTGKVQTIEGTLAMKLRPLIARSNVLYLAAAFAFRGGVPGRVPPDQALVDEWKDRAPSRDPHEAATEFYAANKLAVDRGVKEYVDQMMHFHDALKREQVRSLFLLQPELLMDRTKPLTTVERAIKNHLLTTDCGYQISFFRMVAEQGQQLAATAGLAFHSMLSPFDGATDEVYTDYCHLTPRGNELLAARILDQIETRYPELFAR